MKNVNPRNVPHTENAIKETTYHLFFQSLSSSGAWEVDMSESGKTTNGQSECHRCRWEFVLKNYQPTAQLADSPNKFGADLQQDWVDVQDLTHHKKGWVKFNLSEHQRVFSQKFELLRHWIVLANIDRNWRFAFQRK